MFVLNFCIIRIIINAYQKGVLAMKSFTTAQRLQQIMDARHLKQIDILNAADPFCKKYGVKLYPNDLSQYLSGKHEPGQDKLTIIGLALGVSEAWLMGYDVPMERAVTPIAENDDGRTRECVQLFERLNDDEKDTVIRIIKGFLSEK